MFDSARQPQQKRGDQSTSVEQESPAISEVHEPPVEETVQPLPQQAVVFTLGQIQAFCGACDNYNPQDPFCIADPLMGEGRMRAIARGWCGRSQKSGKSGVMTEGGFAPRA